MKVNKFICPKCKLEKVKSYKRTQDVRIPFCNKCMILMEKSIDKNNFTCCVMGFQRTQFKKLADNIRPPKPEDEGLI